MTNQQIVDNVELAWSHFTLIDTVTAAQLAATIGATRGEMSWMLQQYRGLQGELTFLADYPGAPQVACEGYGPAARWYRLDDQKTAEEHIGYIVADSIYRLIADSKTEAFNTAAADAKYAEHNLFYQSLKAQIELHVFRMSGKTIDLPASLPVR